MNLMLRRLFLLIIIVISVISLKAEGEELSVGVTDSPPFIIIENDDISGLTIDLWNVISDSLNVNYHFVQTDYEKVVTNISEGEINISIAPMAISSSHADSTFLTQPFYITSMCVAVEYHNESGFVTIVKNLFSIAFFVWLAYDVCVEKEFTIRTSESLTSSNVIFASFLLYLPVFLIYLSKALTNAERAALSGEPPYSRKEEL
mgnify:CR=1 FL=1